MTAFLCLFEHHRTAFTEADRYRRGYLPLPEAARVLTRMAAVPPTAVAWLTAGLAHYAATVLQGAADMTYKELGAALLNLSSTTVGPPLAPYGDGGGYMDPQYMHPSYGVQHPYGAQQQPYPDGRYTSAGGMPPGAHPPPQYTQPPVHPTSPYDNRYPQSPQNSYNAPQPPYSPNQYPYSSAAGPYSSAPGAYGAPPAPYGAPPTQYGAPPTQYGAPHAPYGAPQMPYGAPQTPYGAPPSPHGAHVPSSPYSVPPGPYGAQPVGPYGSPPLSPRGSLHGSYDHLAVGGGYGAPAYPGDPGVGGGPSTSAGLPVGAAYYMWTHDNRQAVVQK